MDYTNMSYEELQQVVDAAGQELAARQSAQALDDQLRGVIEDAREGGVAETPEQGAEWVQPTGSTNSYVTGDIVTYNGVTYVSTVTPNIWQPGVAGWRAQTQDGTPPEYVDPAGYADAYQTGDQVTFEGHVYECLEDGTTWSPTVAPTRWKLIS